MAGEALIDELMTRWEELRARGEETTAEELCRDHPELIGTVESAIARLRSASQEATSEWSTDSRLAPSSGLSSGTLGEIWLLAATRRRGKSTALGRPRDPTRSAGSGRSG